MFFDDSAVKSTGKINGGVKRDRTADLLNAIQALSQLSYNPTSSKKDFGIISFLSYEILKFDKIK